MTKRTAYVIMEEADNLFFVLGAICLLYIFIKI